MKKYLNTPQDVIDALKDGKPIFNNTDDSSRTLDKSSGIIISTLPDGGWFVGGCISSDSDPYIKVEDPKPALKLEVGKFYKTRNGSIVLCVYHYIATGFRIINQSNGCDWDVLEDGKCTQNDQMDIIAPCEEEHAEND